MRRIVMVSVLVLAGCVEPGTSMDTTPAIMPAWEPYSCDDSGAAPSGNMPAMPPFEGTHRDFIDHFAKAFDPKIEHEPEYVSDDVMRYGSDGRSSLRIDIPPGGDDGPIPRVTWGHFTGWPGPLEEAINQTAKAAEAMGYPELAWEVQDNVASVWVFGRQENVTVPAVFATFSRPSEHDPIDQTFFGPAYKDFPAPNNTPEAAGARALAFVECGATEIDGPFRLDGKTDLDVVYESRAWKVGVLGPSDPEHHCGGPGLDVWVDAETGAILHWAWFLCY